MPALEQAAGSAIDVRVAHSPNAFDDIMAALDTGDYDEIILETPPSHVSHWLHVDLSQRIAHLGYPLLTRRCTRTERLDACDVVRRAAASSLNRAPSASASADDLAAGRAREPAGESETEAGAARVVARGRASDARLEDARRSRPRRRPAPSSVTVDECRGAVDAQLDGDRERP